MIVTFCGHAQISQSEKIEKWLYAVTQKLIEQGATTFYLGGYGAFDFLAASVLRAQKKRYPQIELILVLAYLNTGRNTSGYDSTVYPPLETTPRRFAISHRNRWMVEASDVVQSKGFPPTYLLCLDCIPVCAEKKSSRCNGTVYFWTSLHLIYR